MASAPNPLGSVPAKQKKDTGSSRTTLPTKLSRSIPEKGTKSKRWALTQKTRANMKSVLNHKNDEEIIKRDMAKGQAYWDMWAHSYDDEFVSSKDDDMEGIIKEKIVHYASALEEDPGQYPFAFDFGCGPGLYLPFLARYFKLVGGCELSKKATQIAEARCFMYPHVKVTTFDLTNTDKNPLMPSILKELKNKENELGSVTKPSFGVCANVLIAVEEKTRKHILNSIYRNMNDNGIVLFVLPSLESALYCNYRMQVDKPKDGIIDPGLTISETRPKQARHILRGIISRDDVPTKHYIREEAEYWLSKNGFKVLETHKVPYEWETEYPCAEDVSPWIQASPFPRPFDLLIICRKSSKLTT